MLLGPGGAVCKTLTFAEALLLPGSSDGLAGVGG